MGILLPLHDSLLGYAAIFICIGISLLFLRKVVKEERSSSYWAASFFLNGLGFLFWSCTETSKANLFFIVGEIFHILGFLALTTGVYLFTKHSFKRWNIYALIGYTLVWLGIINLMDHKISGAFILYSLLRSSLFLWSGTMILTSKKLKLEKGQNLAGWSMICWSAYVLIFPLAASCQAALPLFFGFLVGFHILSVMGMTVLLMSRLQVRAESSEKLVHNLEVLLPICSHCKKIRDEQNNWHQIESYIHERTNADFSHGVCPDCVKKYYPEHNLAGNMK